MIESKGFIERWTASGRSERANYQLFIIEFCQLLDIDPPLPAKRADENDHYRFERPITSELFGDTAKNFIDLYKRDCFVLETKQGVQAKGVPHDIGNQYERTAVARKVHGVRGTSRYDRAMLEAKGQADNYARAVTKENGWLPFIIVCDVGYRFDIYADFSKLGNYTQFPNREKFRIYIEDLKDPAVRELFWTIWNDPFSLNSEKKKTAVTKDIANNLALLVRTFERKDYLPEDVAGFLMRCLFCMFAEDVELIPNGSFTTVLKQIREKPKTADKVLNSLWQSMNSGEFSIVLREDVLKFNGGLFKEPNALPLDEKQIDLLIDAAEKDWTNVEPAIFGTLLEQALDERQRHQLGAHFTPRSYVERLVLPTVIEPLREKWDIVRSSVAGHMENGASNQAIKEVQDFHKELCNVRILDPACGSGNFLYVAFELMKKLEGEVTSTLEELGDVQVNLRLKGHTVDPQQFLGIEVNPRAASVAKLVLWIGYFQQHFRTYGNATPILPVLRDIHNIECRDAILEFDKCIEQKDKSGNPVTRWDGIGTIESPTTGKQIPDPEARIPVFDYVNPRPSKWPDSDFIVGNPPFIGDKRRREFLGDGYSEALRRAYPKIADSTDFVMYWWDKAASKARCGKIRRFGFITTSTLAQVFNRRVLTPHLTDSKSPLSLVFAIPDHPWVDCKDGAKVRIAMTVGRAGNHEGQLLTVISEDRSGSDSGGFEVQFETHTGKIFENLTTEVNVSEISKLTAQEGLSSLGLMLAGKGFKIAESKARELGLGTIPNLENHIKKYVNASDIYHKNRGLYLIDLFGLSLSEVRKKYPAVYQHLNDNVRPVRSSNRRTKLKDKWWIVGEPRSTIRPALKGLKRYIVISETSTFFIFQFLPESILADHKLVIIATDDASTLSVLSSRIHRIWALAMGGMRGKGANVYSKGLCFDTFPFPTLSDAIKTKLIALGEQLEEHRNSFVRENPQVTLSSAYSVMNKVNSKMQLSQSEQEIYNRGLIGVLAELHHQIDNAVAEAYGWSVELSEKETFDRLAELNRVRANEESQGKIQWLRPEYQIPNGKQANISTKQDSLDIAETVADIKQDWPSNQTERLAVVMNLLREMQEATPEILAKKFRSVRVNTIEKLLDMLIVTGVATKSKSGIYRATR